MLGLELRDSAVLALTANGSGVVAARAIREGVSGASVAEAVRAIADGNADGLGIAVDDSRAAPFSDAITAATDAAGVGHTPRVLMRGTAMALAEQWAGAARGAMHVVALCVSDRVHGGVVLDGRPFEGANGQAGAAAWLALNPVERDDYRKFGCLEAEIGASGIVRRMVWRLKSGDTSRVSEMAAGDMSAITVQQICEAARSGDGVAISVMRDTARYIGMAIGNIVSIVDPEVVVVAGLIADAADLMLEPAHAEAVRRVPPRLAQRVRIVIATLGDDAAALGAARATMLST